MKISQDMLNNRAYTGVPTHFAPLSPERVLPEGASDYGDAISVPTGALVQENGDVLFRFYAPSAQTVEIQFLLDGTLLSLSPTGNGIWEAVFPYTWSGPKALQWKIDGVNVLHAYTPIYYSYGHPVNYVDIPDPALEEVLIKDVPHGTVSHEYYFSAATSNWETALVYTPPGYQTGTEHYPVLYLQHGAGEGETSWIWDGKVNFILDNLIAEGKCVPFIVVMNNGMTRIAEDDGLLFPMVGFSRMLLEDCLPFIEKKYRVKGDKWNRAIAGLSMGSMQSSYIGMNHPELFGWLGLFSGFLRTSTLCPDHDFEKQPHLKALTDPEHFAKDYRLLFRCMGTEDNFWPIFLEDDCFLQEISADPEHLICHIRKTYSGFHDWNVWRMCIRDFAQLLFR